MAFTGLINLFKSPAERDNTHREILAEIEEKITEFETKRKEKGLTGQEELNIEKIKRFRHALEQRAGK